MTWLNRRIARLVVPGLGVVVAVAVATWAFAGDRGSEEDVDRVVGSGSEADRIDGEADRIESEAAPAVGLLVCVQAEARSQLPLLRARVEEALGFARTTQAGWALMGLGDDKGTVDEGCPGGYVEPPDDAEGFEEVRPAVYDGDPSPYRLAVFVVPDLVAERSFPERAYLRLVFEMQCESHSRVCWEVSTAIFVRESSLIDGSALFMAIPDALGIVDEVEKLYPKGHPEWVESEKYSPGIATAEGWEDW